MRNAFILILISACVGAAAGSWLAHRDVGEITTALYPSSDLAAGPAFDAAPAESSKPATVSEAPAPRAEVPNPTFDFGAMPRGSSESHGFVVKNTGTEPLRIEMGPTSCKCTLSDADAGQVAPGESTTVTLSWVAKVNAGPFRQTATVLTNDPRRPRLELSVEGEVTDVTGMQPREFLIGKVGAGDETEASIYLGAYDDEKLEVTAAMADGTRNPELYEVNVVPIDAAEAPIRAATSAVRIDVKAGPGLPLGALTEWVEIQTSLEAAPTVLAPIVGAVEGDISIHGRGWNRTLGVLNFGTVPSSEGAGAKLLVSFKGEHAADAAAEVVDVDPQWLVAEIGEPRRVSDSKTHIPLNIKIPPGQAPVIRNESGQSDGDARVVLKTEHPDTPEIDVRVRFIVSQ